jgi:DNA-binding transcriptional MerR regulator
VSLRHYETTGLLVSNRIDDGYRDYRADAIWRIRQIRALLAAGMSLSELGPLLSCVVGKDRPCCDVRPRSMPSSIAWVSSTGKSQS